jgi:hypothetical protein
MKRKQQQKRRIFASLNVRLFKKSASSRKVIQLQIRCNNKKGVDKGFEGGHSLLEHVNRRIPGETGEGHIILHSE